MELENTQPYLTFVKVTCFDEQEFRRQKDIISETFLDGLAQPVTDENGEEEGWSIYINAPTDTEQQAIEQRLSELGLSDMWVASLIVEKDGEQDIIRDFDLTSNISSPAPTSPEPEQMAQAASPVAETAPQTPTTELAVPVAPPEQPAVAAGFSAEMDEDELEAYRLLQEQQAKNQELLAQREAELYQAQQKALLAEQTAQQKRLEAEEAERAAQEALDEQRLVAVGQNEEGMLAYVSELTIPVTELKECVLPKIVATDATNAVTEVVTGDLLTPDKKRITSILPAVTLSVTSENDDAFIDEDTNYINMAEAELMLNYLEEAEKLTSSYDNARLTLHAMTDEEFDEVQAIIAERLGAAAKSELDSINAVRAEMFEQMDGINQAIEEARADYADGLRAAMQEAAIQAAQEYADDNRRSSVLACEQTMLTQTVDVAEMLTNSSARSYKTLMMAEHSINDDDLAPATRRNVHAYLSCLRYRILSDRAMASYVHDLADDKLNYLNSLFVEDDEYDFNDDLEVEDTEATTSTPTTGDAANAGERFTFDYDAALDEIDKDEQEEASEPKHFAADTAEEADSDDLSDLDEDEEEDTEEEVEFSDESEVTTVINTEEPTTFGVISGEDAAQEDKKKSFFDKFSKTQKIVAGVVAGVLLAGALGIGGMAFARVGLFAPQQAQVVESQTDPRGLYKAGDSYKVMITKDGRPVETTITIGKFVDSPDDTSDYIVATDADGNEYKVSYEKMEKFAQAKSEEEAKTATPAPTPAPEQPAAEQPAPAPAPAENPTPAPEQPAPAENPGQAK